MFECKCGSKDVFMDTTKMHTGLYCAECGRWIKWLNKNEIRLVRKQIEANISKGYRDKFMHDFNKTSYR